MDIALQEFIDNDFCNVIIIREEQVYFCAGLDLKVFSEEPAPGWRETFQDDW
jgi:enoyl-CoA hydratase/carnithine racemase